MVVNEKEKLLYGNQDFINITAIVITSSRHVSRFQCAAGRNEDFVVCDYG